MTTPDAPHAGHGGGLGKQIGPLPAGVWVASIAGGLVLAYYLRRHQAATTVATLDASSLPADNTSTAPGAGNLYAPSGTDAGALVSSTPQTNDQWAQLAERRLIGMAFSPLLVDAAISAYLSGQALTPSQQAVITEALIQVGPPPSSPPPPLPGTSSDPVHVPVVPSPVTMPTHRGPVAFPSRPITAEPLATTNRASETYGAFPGRKLT